MTTSEQIADLLDQLQNQTGIRFAITDNQADEEETILILKNMLRAQHDGTSRESFLRGLLLTAEVAVQRPVRQIGFTLHTFHDGLLP